MSEIKVGVAVDGDVPVATVNGSSFPLVDYAITHEDGRVLVSLVVSVDAVSVGRSPAVGPAPEPKVSSWGDPTAKDPRAAIPGWEPQNLGGQVAGHAERMALKTYEPSKDQTRNWVGGQLLHGGVGGSTAVTA